MRRVIHDGFDSEVCCGVFRSCVVKVRYWNNARRKAMRRRSSYYMLTLVYKWNSQEIHPSPPSPLTCTADPRLSVHCIQITDYSHLTDPKGPLAGIYSKVETIPRAAWFKCRSNLIGWMINRRQMETAQRHEPFLMAASSRGCLGGPFWRGLPNLCKCHILSSLQSTPRARVERGDHTPESLT